MDTIRKRNKKWPYCIALFGMENILLGRSRSGVGVGVGVDIFRPELKLERSRLKFVDPAALLPTTYYWWNNLKLYNVCYHAKPHNLRDNPERNSENCKTNDQSNKHWLVASFAGSSEWPESENGCALQCSRQSLWHLHLLRYQVDHAAHSFSLCWLPWRRWIIRCVCHCHPEVCMNMVLQN